MLRTFFIEYIYEQKLLWINDFDWTLNSLLLLQHLWASQSREKNILNTCRAILISVVAPNFRLNRIESGYNYIHNLEEHRMATSEEILWYLPLFLCYPSILQNVKRILLTRGTRTFTKMNLVLLESREMIVATHAHKNLTHTHEVWNGNEKF